MNQETLNTVIVVVVVPVMAALVPMIVNAINLYAKRIKSQLDDQELRKYVDLAEDCIQTAVIATYQTYVKALKDNGEWDAETESEAFEKAKTEALLLMGESAREALKLFYDDFDKWINNKIEKSVRISK